MVSVPANGRRHQWQNVKTALLEHRKKSACKNSETIEILRTTTDWQIDGSLAENRGRRCIGAKGSESKRYLYENNKGAGVIKMGYFRRNGFLSQGSINKLKHSMRVVHLIQSLLFRSADHSLSSSAVCDFE